jgi:hypothetical protein
MDPKPLPRMNAKDMEKRCDAMVVARAMKPILRLTRDDAERPWNDMSPTTSNYPPLGYATLQARRLS